jgi:hypothetical protein
MALELAGENPTPLEVLLSERVASLWVLVELQEALLAAWYYKAKATSPRSSARWPACRRAPTVGTSPL